MEIKIKVEKKHAFMILGAILLLAGVIAYNPSGTGGIPSEMGHSVDELDWNQRINANINLYPTSKIGFRGDPSPEYTIDMPLTGSKIRVGGGTTNALPANVGLGLTGANMKIMIKDNSQANNYVLTSDANGIGTWKDKEIPASERVNKVYYPSGTNSDTINGLTNGLWHITIYGTLPNVGTEGSYNISIITANQNTQMEIRDHPDGTAPFSVTRLATVPINGQLIISTTTDLGGGQTPLIFGATAYRIGVLA